MKERHEMALAQIIYLSDRMLLNDRRIPYSVLDELKNQGLIAPDMHKIHFCGIISFSDGLAVFLPRNYAGSQEKLDRAGHYLIMALLKFYHERETSINAHDSGEDLIGGMSLSLIASIFDDYTTNGLYVRRTRERTKNLGKVNWPRTIARNSVCHTPSGPIFLDLATNRSKYIANCETAKIHALVLKELYLYYGILWFGDSNVHDERIIKMQPPLGSVETQIAYLKRELQLSYSERDLFLIHNLIQYLEIKKGSKNGPILIGVRKFHNMWESMLDQCLVGKWSINKKLPVPVYKTLDSQFVPIANKAQRTDTVLQNGTNIAIIDAKYYEASSPNTAPGWPDLVKQFYYQKAVSSLVSTDTKVSNHFIFPGNSKTLDSVYVAARDAIVKSEENCLPDYSPIYCHFQDPLELLRGSWK
jgi:hypothetical protein